MQKRSADLLADKENRNTPGATGTHQKQWDPDVSRSTARAGADRNLKQRENEFESKARTTPAHGNMYWGLTGFNHQYCLVQRVPNGGPQTRKQQIHHET